ncbi:MAG: diphthine--ammonia ligase [Candidatus Nitrosocaldaceae archaeon]
MLYSGGKDSNFTIYNTLKEGYDVLLLTIIPKSAESMLFHYPNIEYVNMQAKCMNLSLIEERVDANTLEQEMLALFKILKIARDEGIKKIYSGGIASRFQNERFRVICNKLGLEYGAPLWKRDQKEYMYELLDLGFRFIIDAVAAYGLDDKWLGRLIDKDAVDELIRLSIRYGFNVTFEGGEAESFVIDAPHFKKMIVIDDARIEWDGVRGVYKITKASIEKKIY